jgi:hypothetical protein
MNNNDGSNNNKKQNMSYSYHYHFYYFCHHKQITIKYDYTSLKHTEQHKQWH